MNKKERAALIGMVIAVFFIGFIFFSNVTTEVKVNIQGKDMQTVKVPAMYSMVQVIFLLLLAAFGTFCSVFYFSDLSKKVSTTKKEKTVLRVLEGDAKRLYKYMLDKGECLQKDLIYELRFSKAKVTRILDRLVEKRVVERVSYGKTNKIRLVK